MSKRRGLRIHRGDEGLDPARIGAPERGSRAVLGRHQRKEQQLAPSEHVARAQTRARAFQGIDVIARENDALVEVEPAVEDHHRGHQLGDGGDRRHRIGIFVDDHLAGVGVEHQRRRRSQVDGFLDLRFLRLRKANGDGQDKEQGKDGDDALERMEFSLHVRMNLV